MRCKYISDRILEIENHISKLKKSIKKEIPNVDHIELKTLNKIISLKEKVCSLQGARKVYYEWLKVSSHSN